MGAEATMGRDTAEPGVRYPFWQGLSDALGEAGDIPYLRWQYALLTASPSISL